MVAFLKASSTKYMVYTVMTFYILFLYFGFLKKMLRHFIETYGNVGSFIYIYEYICTSFFSTLQFF